MASTSKVGKAPHDQLSNSGRPRDQRVTHLLKGTNYSPWRRVVSNALISRHKMVFVDGRLPKLVKGDHSVARARNVRARKIRREERHSVARACLLF